MSFNGADSAGTSSLNPSTTLGGSSGSHDITPGDIAVIVGAVVVLALIVFGVFYYRQLRARRARAEELTLEMGGAQYGLEGCEENGDEGKKDAVATAGAASAAPIWKFVGWKDREKDGKEVQEEMRAREVQEVRYKLDCSSFD